VYSTAHSTSQGVRNHQRTAFTGERWIRKPTQPARDSEMTNEMLSQVTRGFDSLLDLPGSPKSSTNCCHGYLMMRTLNAKLLKSFPIFGECLSMRLPNPTYFFPYVGNSRCWEILLHGIPSSNRSWENREKPCLCCPF